MKFVEHRTPGNYFLKVNRVEGNYTISKEGRLLTNDVSLNGSILHSIKRVVFIGKSFKSDFTNEETGVSFFHVFRSQLIVPFRQVDMSDVRHIRLPVDIECDMLPVAINYFRNLDIGIYMNAFNHGFSYFVLEPIFGRKEITRLKIKFPKSRIIIYRADSLSSVLEENFVRKKYNFGEDPDMEVIKQNDIGLLSKNVLFSVRIYIQNQDWDQLLELPTKLIISSEEARLIAYYLNIEMNYIDEKDKQKEAQLKRANRLYLAVYSIFSAEMKKLERYFSESSLDSNFIKRLEQIIYFRKKNLSYSNEDQEMRSFLDKVLVMLKEGKRGLL